MVQTAAKHKGTERVRRKRSGSWQGIKQALSDLAELPPYAEAPELYRDWGEEGDFVVQVGRGECAQ